MNHRNKLNLNGTWKRLLNGKQIDFVPVPGSYRPLGECTLEHEFSLPAGFISPESRYFLCTEGVLAAAEFTINGTRVGQAGPWVPYRFELAGGLLREHNVIQAKVRDVVEYFGGTLGRRFDAGLVRDIFIEQASACFIEDFAFRAKLSPDASSAACTVSATLNGSTAALLECELKELPGQKVVASARGSADAPVSFSVAAPRLWSPDTPHLYKLSVRLSGPSTDEVSETVGFRAIEIRGRDFFLNNRRLILKGVCRHEFTETHGYSVPLDEVRRELNMIKQAGFNFIRLVHAPQALPVARLAAEIGLLVSEEPGACWNDLADEELVGPALESLRRLVVRDRNCPSVFAWLIYNECHPNIPYAERAVKLCRELDPERLVSFADCSYKYDEIKAMVQAADLSFYGINMYDFNQDRYVQLMQTLTDKPLVLTEWGGLCAQGNPRVLGNLCTMLIKHSREKETDRLAGSFFWVWADYEERGRGLPAAPEGYTLEGLVDRQGRPKPDLQQLSDMWFEMDHPKARTKPEVQVLAKAALRSGTWKTVSLDKIAGDQTHLERELDEMRSRYPDMVPIFGQVCVSGIPFDGRDAHVGHPLLLGKGREEIIVPIGQKVRQVAMLGHITLKGGYLAFDVKPSHSGARAKGRPLGAPASDYQFIFSDGTVVEPLLHGVHILRGNNIYRSWTIAPRSSETMPAIQAMVDPNFEVLRYDLWEKEFPQPRFLKEIRWQLKDPESIQALLAVSVQA